jgi:hypothetical protein
MDIVHERNGDEAAKNVRFVDPPGRARCAAARQP